MRADGGRRRPRLRADEEARRAAHQRARRLRRRLGRADDSRAARRGRGGRRLLHRRGRRGRRTADPGARRCSAAWTSTRRRPPRSSSSSSPACSAPGSSIAAASSTGGSRCRCAWARWCSATWARMVNATVESRPLTLIIAAMIVFSGVYVLLPSRHAAGNYRDGRGAAQQAMLLGVGALVGLRLGPVGRRRRALLGADDAGARLHAARRDRHQPGAADRGRGLRHPRQPAVRLDRLHHRRLGLRVRAAGVVVGARTAHAVSALVAAPHGGVALHRGGRVHAGALVVSSRRGAPRHPPRRRACSTSPSWASTSSTRRTALQALQTRNLDAMVPGQIAYTLLLKEDGAVLHRRHRVVPRPRALLALHRPPQRLRRPRCSGAFTILALQGPASGRILARVLGPDAVGNLRYFRFLEKDDLIVARLGFSGELGYELLVPAPEAAALRQKLLDAGRTKGCALRLGRRRQPAHRGRLRAFRPRDRRPRQPARAGLGSLCSKNEVSCRTAAGRPRHPGRARPLRPAARQGHERMLLAHLGQVAGAGIRQPATHRQGQRGATRRRPHRPRCRASFLRPETPPSARQSSYG